MFDKLVSIYSQDTLNYKLEKIELKNIKLKVEYICKKYQNEEYEIFTYRVINYCWMRPKFNK